MAIATEACVKADAAIGHAIGNVVDLSESVIIGANDEKERHNLTGDYVTFSRIVSFCGETRWSWRRDSLHGERDAPGRLGWFDAKSELACSSWTTESVLPTEKSKHSFSRHPGISWDYSDAVSARSSGVRYFETDNRFIWKPGDGQISDCYRRGLLNFGIIKLPLRDVGLPPHSAPLQERGTEIQNRGESYYPSRDGQAPGVPGKSIFLGILVILSGGCLIFVALQFAYKGDQSRKMLATSIIIGIFGAILTIHGLFFVCTGVWFPFSTSLDRRSEDVRVLHVIITKLELGKIKLCKPLYGIQSLEGGSSHDDHYRSFSFDRDAHRVSDGSNWLSPTLSTTWADDA